MRQRGIHYWWAGLGILVLVVMYAAPIAGAFRQPKAYDPVKPLPQLTVPAAAFPLLRVPKVHRLAPLAPLPRSAAAPASQSVPAAPQKTVRRTTVPVVSDQHSQVAPAKPQTATSTETKDPFADTPVVADAVGTLAPLDPGVQPTQAPPAASQEAPPPEQDPSTVPADDSAAGVALSDPDPRSATGTRPERSLATASTSGSEGTETTTIDSASSSTGDAAPATQTETTTTATTTDPASAGSTGSDTTVTATDAAANTETADAAAPVDATVTEAGSADDVTASAANDVTPTTVTSTAAPAAAKLSSADVAHFKGGVDSALSQLATTVTQLVQATPTLSDRMPLAQTSLDDLLGLSDSFAALATGAHAALGALDAASIDDVVNALQGISADLPHALRGLGFSSSLTNTADHVVAYLILGLRRADAATCRDEHGCIHSKSGLDTAAAGVDLDADADTAGVQAPVLDVSGAVGLNLAVGVDVTGRGGAFIRSDSTVEIAVFVSSANVNATAQSGSATQQVSGDVGIGGVVTLSFADPTPSDGGLSLSELAPAAVRVATTETGAPIVLRDAAGGSVTIVGSLFGGGRLSAQLIDPSGGRAATSGASAPTASVSVLSATTGGDATTAGGTGVASGAVSTSSIQATGGTLSTLTSPSTSGVDAPTPTATTSGDTSSTGATSGSSTLTGSAGSATAPDPSGGTTLATSGSAGDGSAASQSTDTTLSGAGSPAAAGTTSSSSPATSTTTTANGPDATSTIPAGTDGTPPDPNANTASGLSPPASNVTVSNGGTVTSADGSATVTFAPGGVSGDALVTITQIATGGYELTAIDVATGAQIHTFAIPPILTLRISATGTAGQLYYVDAAGALTPIQTTIDLGSRETVAQLPHFSTVTSTGTSTDLVLTATGGDDKLELKLDSATPGNLLIHATNGSVDDFSFVAPTNSLTIDLGGGNDSILMYDVSTVYAHSIVLKGGAGDDTYSFKDNWGAVTIATPDANGTNGDTLDFTPLSESVLDTLTVNLDKTVLTAGTSTVTQDASSLAEEINIVVSYADPSGLTASLKSAYDKLSQLVDSLDATVHALSNALPLIDPNAGSSISKIVAFVDDVKALRDQVNPKISELTAPTNTTLGDVIGKLNSAISSLPALLSGLKFTTEYRGAVADSKLEVLIDVDLPTATVNKAIPLSLGADVAALGVTLDANPATAAVEPVTLTVVGTLAIHIAIGLPAASPSDVFLAPGGTVNLTVGATLAAGTLKINLSLLEGSITLGAPITFNGSLGLTLKDPQVTSDGRISLGEIGTSAVEIASNGTITNPITLTATLGNQLTVGSGPSPAPLASATLTITFSNGSNIFGDASGNPLDIHVDFKSSGSDATNLFQNFSNAGPNEILGMLGQVANFFTGLANQQILNATIPFTNVTIGSVLDYGKAFKHDFLDPLFKSGDSLKPDSNGDGNLTLDDLNFTSIQSLLDRLSVALGLPVGTLKANFDPAKRELTFSFSFDRTFGIGTSVDTVDAAKGSVRTVAQGGSAAEVDELIFNGTGSFVVSIPGHSTTINATDDKDMVKTKIGSLGFGVDTVEGQRGFWKIKFLGTANVPDLSVDASGLSSDESWQVVVVPDSAANFWLAYTNASNQLVLTDALTKSISTSDLVTALSSKLGLTADVLKYAATDSTIFTVHITSPSSGLKRLTSAGGLSIDFGTSLGDLGSVQTTGSIIPLARLIAGATFGINLSSSQSVAADPGTFSPGPRVDVIPDIEGGKSVTVTTLRPGATGISEIQVLTARAASGTYKLSFDGSTSSDIQFNADPATDGGAFLGVLNTLTGGKVSSVSRVSRPEGFVYTITFTTAAGPVSQLGVSDTSALVARSETQMVVVSNATEGTYRLALSVDLNGDGTISASESGLSNPIAFDGGVAAIISAFAGHLPTGVTLAPGSGAGEVTFGGAADKKDVGLFTADTSALKGALSNGKLTGTANFDASLFNGPGIVALTWQDGTASVSVGTVDEGGLAIGVTTATPGAGTEVQDLTGPTGTSFTITGGTGTLVYGTSTSAEVATVLATVASIGAVANVLVLTSASGGNTTYRVIFTGTLDKANVAQLAVSAGTATTVKDGGGTVTNETQVVTARASSGLFMLQFGGESTGGLAYNALAPDVQAALEGLSTIGAGNVSVTLSTVPAGNAYSVTFKGIYAGADVPALGATNPAAPGLSAVPLGVGLLVGGVVYTYVVTAVVGGKETLPSNPALALTTPLISGPPPIQPVTSVLLNWSPVVGATSYKIYRSGGLGNAVITAFATTFLDDGTAPFEIPTPVPTTSQVTLTQRNEVQEITVTGAVGGTYSLGFTFDANGNGAIDAGESPSPVTVQATATADDLRAALESLTSIGAGNVAVAFADGIYTIAFIGALAGKNVPTLALSAVSLTPQNEIQKVQIVSATGGSFTLTVSYTDGATEKTGKTAPIAFGASAADVRTKLESATVNGVPIGPGQFDVTRVGSTYTIEFKGTLANRDIDALVGDAGGLVNEASLSTMSVAFTSSATTVDQLVSQLQAKIDDAVVAAGLTPGFLVAMVTAGGSGFTATVARPFGAVNFTPQGDHIHSGQVSHLDDNDPVAGAVQTIVAHPTNINIVWIGTVNGGVWRSTNFDSGTSGSVQWQPLLDLGPSMSIQTLVLDPTVTPTAADGSDAVLLAGLGQPSNFGLPSVGSFPIGIYRSTNGGDRWTVLGEKELSGLSITGIAARGQVIVVAGRQTIGATLGGVFRSTDGGATFPRISGNAAIFGLPSGDALDLVGDPTDMRILYVAIAGHGVFVSVDMGEHWSSTGGDPATGQQQFNTGAPVIGPQEVVGPSTGWVTGQTVNVRISVSAATDTTRRRHR